MYNDETNKKNTGYKMHRQIAEGVDWIGYVDWPVRNFHGYTTRRGSSYNAYLVRGKDKTALIDTVKAPFSHELIANISELTDLASVDYVVCNHAEPDHAGSLPAVMAALPNATLVLNSKCLETLGLELGNETVSKWKTLVVVDGASLDLGSRTLKFFNTPMVHWPESMVTYLAEDAILFSMDIFGQHYATSERFDTEADLTEVFQEAKTYYSNIVLLYARPAAAALEKLSHLELKTVCPSHGIIWTKHFPEIVEKYKIWAPCKPTKKVVIFFTTMWGSTRKMAQAIADGASACGVDVKLFDMTAVDDTDLVPEIMDAGAIAAGSPTMNIGIMPRMAKALTYLRGLKPAGKCGLTFGSFGWASKGAEEAAGYLESFGVEQIHEPITCRFAPDKYVLEKCRAAGKLLAEAAIAKAEAAR